MDNRRFILGNPDFSGYVSANDSCPDCGDEDLQIKFVRGDMVGRVCIDDTCRYSDIDN